MLTPYQFASNTPIAAIDIDGKEAGLYQNGTIGASGTPLSNYFDNKKGWDGWRAAMGIGTGIGAAALVDVFVTKGKLTQFIFASQFFGHLYHNRTNDPLEQQERQKQGWNDILQAGIGWSTVKIIGGVVSIARSGIPQGLTASEFKIASQRIYDEVKDISDDIVVHGSRAAGTAKTSSDIDFAIRVDSEKFNQLIEKAFGHPNIGSAKWKTMQNAIKLERYNQERQD